MLPRLLDEIINGTEVAEVLTAGGVSVMCIPKNASICGAFVCKLVYYELGKTGKLEGDSDVSGKTYYYCMHCNWLLTRPTVEEYDLLNSS